MEKDVRGSIRNAGKGDYAVCGILLALGLVAIALSTNERSWLTKFVRTEVLWVGGWVFVVLGFIGLAFILADFIKPQRR